MRERLNFFQGPQGRHKTECRQLPGAKSSSHQQPARKQSPTPVWNWSGPTTWMYLEANSPSQPPDKSPGQLIPWFWPCETLSSVSSPAHWTSDLQNCDTESGCCFKPIEVGSKLLKQQYKTNKSSQKSLPWILRFANGETEVQKAEHSKKIIQQKSPNVPGQFSCSQRETQGSKPKTKPWNTMKTFMNYHNHARHGDSNRERKQFPACLHLSGRRGVHPGWALFIWNPAAPLAKEIGMGQADADSETRILKSHNLEKASPSAKVT